MVRKHQFYIILLLLGTQLVSNCHQKKPHKEQLVTNKTLLDSPQKVSTKKKQKTVIKRRNNTLNDTLNDQNAVPFLLNYGKNNPETIVLFETRLGSIKIRLYRDTPLHRANFIFLTKTGYFNTTCFHRIVPGFIIQGGNSDHPSTRKMRMQYNFTLPAEMKSHHKHKYGALAAAREWENNPQKQSSPFEFYMIQDKRGAYHLEGEHTVYGEIIEGFDTMNKIAKLETDKKEWPLKEVFIKATVIQ